MLLPVTHIRTKDELSAKVDEILELIRANVTDPRKVRDLTLALGALDSLAGVAMETFTLNMPEDLRTGTAKLAAHDAMVRQVIEKRAAAYGFKLVVVPGATAGKKS